MDVFENIFSKGFNIFFVIKKIKYFLKHKKFHNIIFVLSFQPSTCKIKNLKK